MVNVLGVAAVLTERTVRWEERIKQTGDLSAHLEHSFTVT